EEDLFAAYRTDIGDSSVTAARTEVREADSGRLVHTEEDAEAAGIGGGVLVVERRTPPYDPAPAGPPADDVAGVDPRTVEERWSLDGRYERPRVAAVAGDRAVLVEHGGGTAVLDPATGEEIAATATRADRCSGTAEPLLVCRAGGTGPATAARSRWSWRSAATGPRSGCCRGSPRRRGCPAWSGGCSRRTRTPSSARLRPTGAARPPT